MGVNGIARTSSAPAARPLTVLAPLIRGELAAGRDHYRMAGKLLLEARSGSKHGAFKPWIAQHFALSYRQASNYMRAAAAKGETRFTFRGVAADPRTRRQHQTVGRRARPVDPTEAEDKAIRAMARDVIDAGHRALAVKLHPDKPGGSLDAMTRLNRARAVLVQCILDWGE